MFLSYMELAFAAILLLMLVTQIAVPAFRGTPIFPFLRREKHLAAQLELAEEEVLEAALASKIAKRRKEAERLRPRSRGPLKRRKLFRRPKGPSSSIQLQKQKEEYNGATEERA
jgi:hypothetical protein